MSAQRTPFLNVAAVICAFLLYSLQLVSNSYAADFEVIDTARLHSLVVDNAYELEGGRKRLLAVIDARPKAEYAKVHIFSAINIPENAFEALTNLLPRDKGALLVVYSDQSGTSRRWAEKARAAGYTSILIYSEGLTAWKVKELPVAPL